MKTFNISRTNNPGSGWQILGELELKFETGTEERIHIWLAEKLRVLGLHNDFLGRIQRSAQDAARHLLHAETGLKLDHVHLVMYVPEVYEEQVKAWGYFEIEKIETAVDGLAGAAHAIEFYLYQEGREERDSP